MKTKTSSGKRCRLSAAGRLALALLLVLAALSLTGCPGSWRRPQKGAGSALWLGQGSEKPEASQLARLKERGVGECFIEAAVLDLGPGGGGLAVQKTPELPPSTPVTLVVTGTWPEGGLDAEEAAGRIAEGAQQVRFAAEGLGLVPVGLHFDLQQVGTLVAYAELLEKLRAKLDRTLFLSVSLVRSWMDDPELGQLVEAVDFVVPFLYGQRAEEPEDPAAWDFIKMQQGLEKLETIGTPYLIGSVTLGSASYLSARGELKERSTAISIQEILWNRSLKLRHGFTLEGVNRQVFTLRAERPTRAGVWRLKEGEEVRVVRPTTFHFEEIQRLVGAWHVPNALGQVYYRLPQAGELLSLTLDNLVNALEPSAAEPELEFDAAVRRRTGRGLLLGFSLENVNGEVTDFSLIDKNYLQITTDSGTFGRVEVGDFYRFDLFRAAPGKPLERTYREPNVVRLYAPMLEGRKTLHSSDVELLGGGSPALTIEASFVLPNGKQLQVGPRRWRDGKLEPGPEESAEQ